MTVTFGAGAAAAAPGAVLYWGLVDPDRWLAQARQGDRVAFNRLLETHQDLVYNVAYHHLGQADDALDACQEAMLAAWRGLPRFDGDSDHFRRWLVRIVINACRDQQRHDRRRPQVPLEFEREGEIHVLPLPDPGESPENYAERADLRALLEHALSKLSVDHRTIILLDQAGFDYAAMADILGVESGTVKSRLSRARVQLRALLTAPDETALEREPGPAMQRYDDQVLTLPRSPSERRGGSQAPAGQA
jgi:RNA polymerase sigma-70 factor, ECF subfamily